MGDLFSPKGRSAQQIRCNNVCICTHAVSGHSILYGKAQRYFATFVSVSLLLFCFAMRTQADTELETCSQDALQNAILDGGVITFPEDCTNFTLTTTLIINNDVTLDAGTNQVIINGANAFRIFQVQEGASLTLIGL